MKFKLLYLALTCSISTAWANSTPVEPQSASGTLQQSPLQDWPHIKSAFPENPQTEAKIKEILSKMTLEEKVGQMIQPDYRQVTPEEAKEYKLGSILNGGGGWPNGNKFATPLEWAKAADSYWFALKDAYKGEGYYIPFMWATDAVHGHNNVFNAVLYPHNIGLGAANDPELIRKIGEATAASVAATGLDWTFAPTVTTPRDYRWGRVYEGYSEDPVIVAKYAKQMVEGLQGTTLKEFANQKHVISTVKHWVGDGGTTDGVDRGENDYTELQLINLHAKGFFTGIAAGAQSVMSSFNSWKNPKNYEVRSPGNKEPYNYKIHGSKYLITDVLKNKIGFDGIVVTDWNGQEEIPGCSAANCPEAVNAGNDVFMVTTRSDWKPFYHNVIQQVKDGIIPMSRIDDAVTRILRVKMRAGLWDKPQPSKRLLVVSDDTIGSKAHQALARRAVSESLVLLKNNDHLLPLESGQNYLVVGSAADNIQKQTGGWSLTWQGTENTLADFPHAQTFLMAIKDAAGKNHVFTDITKAPKDSIAIVVVGEKPYAEMMGDIKAQQNLSLADMTIQSRSDLELLKKLKKDGYKTVTVMYSGRPMYVNEEINLSDAFVEAWLPGTQVGGITDVLFAKDGKDFRGRLSFSWPNTKCATTINRDIPGLSAKEQPVQEQSEAKDPNLYLFKYGYGLNYKSNKVLGQLPLDPRTWGCGEDKPIPGAPAKLILEIMSSEDTNEFIPRIGGDTNGWKNKDVSGEQSTTIGSLTTTPINYKHQQDALTLSWYGDRGEYQGKSASQFYVQTPDSKGVNLKSYLDANGRLEFDVKLSKAVPAGARLAMHCEYPCMADVPLSKAVDNNILNKWQTVSVPLQCFKQAGMNFKNTNTPFLLFNTKEMNLDLGKVRWVPKVLSKMKPVDCNVLQ